MNLGAEQISDVVQTNSATAEEEAAASEGLSAQAQLLYELLSKFILESNESGHDSFSGSIGTKNYQNLEFEDEEAEQDDEDANKY